MLGLKAVILGTLFLIGYVAHYGADLPSFEQPRSQVILGIAAVLTLLGMRGGMLGLKFVLVGTALLTGYIAHYGADLSWFWATRSQLFIAIASAMIIIGMLRSD